MTVLAFLLAAGTAAQVAVSVHAPKELVVGFPLQLSVQATPLVPSAMSPWEFRTWVRRKGQEWSRHREAEPTWEQGVPGGAIALTPPGGSYSFETQVHLVHLGEYYADVGLVFAEPGQYEVAVTYERERRHALPPNESPNASAPIRIRVVQPAGKDAALFRQRLRQRPGLLSPAFAPIADADGTEVCKLLSAYPNSVYARLWRAALHSGRTTNRRLSTAADEGRRGKQ